MTDTLHDVTVRVADRLGDEAGDIWSHAELQLYLKDGYDRYTRRTKCLFDIHCIPNVPITGNWQTDLERYFGLTKAGWGLTDERLTFSGDYLKNWGTGKYGSKEYGPSLSRAATPATSPSEITYFDSDNFNAISSDLPTAVPGGHMPQHVVDVLRVYFHERTLKGMSSQVMRELDPNYESREGDPQWFTVDKDGLFYLRVVPVAGGDAVYDTIDVKDNDGTPHDGWGVLTRRLDSDDDVEDTIDEGGADGWGIMVHREDITFPALGPWGHPTWIHPHTDNIIYEVHRLGRDLDTHEFEIPQAYLKYVEYYACAQALEKVGPGQSMKLAKHYYERYEMGVERMTQKKRDMLKERVGRLGGGEIEESNFGLGDPQPPFPYGEPF